MSRINLQNTIQSNGGFIFSDGTLNLQHLLPKVYDLLSTYTIRGAKHGCGSLRESILECFEIKPEDKPFFKLWGGLFAVQYWGKAELKEYRHGDIALDPTDVWDAACNFFESIAPSGYYFGSIEGDGACIGWFKYEEEAV